jgi:hypothetical protein
MSGKSKDIDQFFNPSFLVDETNVEVDAKPETPIDISENKVKVKVTPVEVLPKTKVNHRVSHKKKSNKSSNKDLLVFMGSIVGAFIAGFVMCYGLQLGHFIH